MEFNSENVSIVELQTLIDKIPEKYELLDRTPMVQLVGTTQYVTFKLIEKNPEQRKIGFSF
jgi:hypothetical protein